MRVRNLSETGLGGKCREPHGLSPNEAVAILFRNCDPIAASIIHVSDLDVGVRFDQAVDPRQLTAANAKPAPLHQAVADMQKLAEHYWREALATETSQANGPANRARHAPIRSIARSFGRRGVL